MKAPVLNFVSDIKTVPMIRDKFPIVTDLFRFKA
jgi:hypothetical protein